VCSVWCSRLTTFLHCKVNTIGNSDLTEFVSNLVWFLRLTLIQSGKVKVDLANFDVKFRTKFFYVFWIFSDCWHNVKKWRFDVHFDDFSLEVLPQHYHSDLPASNRFYCFYRPPECGKSPARLWSQCGAAQATFLSISRPGPCRVRGEAGSQSGLSLSKVILPTVLSEFPKPQRSITHPPHTGRGEFKPRESEVKTEQGPSS
jgi:hypothetical protein